MLQKRRERINDRLKTLQSLVPNGTKVDISTMLEDAVHYVKFLQLQIKVTTFFLVGVLIVSCTARNHVKLLPKLCFTIFPNQTLLSFLEILQCSS